MKGIPNILKLNILDIELLKENTLNNLRKCHYIIIPIDISRND